MPTTDSEIESRPVAVGTHCDGEGLLLISPVRNEAAHIDAVAEAVAGQIRLPDRWLVIDDESTDETLPRLRELERRIPFMEVLTAPRAHISPGADRLARAAVERAYNHALEGVDLGTFAYVGKLDGDTVLPDNYLEEMIHRFELDPDLGVAGGALIEQRDGEWREVPTPADHATGPCRIYRRDCLEAIGGIPVRLGSDPIAVTYARVNGFKARTFRDLPVRHLRPMGSTQGQLRGRMRHGATHYVVRYGPLWAALRSLKLAISARPRGLGGLAFMVGYLGAALRGESRVEDDEFVAYVRREQRNRMVSGLRRSRAADGDHGDSPRPRDPGAGSRDRVLERRERVIEVARRLETHGAGSDWIGSDPYEGLNATRFVAPLKRTFRGRQVIIQAVKRSPLDLRRVLGIEPGQNSATLAWAVSTYSRARFLDAEEGERKLRTCLAALERLRCTGFDEPCWGYHFDTQSRVFFYSKRDPNTIATAFAAQALLDAYDRLGEESLLLEAVGVGEFFLRHIRQTRAARGAYFGYIVGDTNAIQNANTHVCAVLARLTEHVDDDRFRRAAQEGIEYALSHQRPDGSWLYGERADLAWVDGYHHGYVLDALRVCDEAGVDDRLPEAIERGLDYYERELLLADGTPKYFSHEVYPIDSQSYAQAIQTFSIAASRDPRRIEPARRVFDWTTEQMRRRDGLFRFQRRRHWSNPLPHMRWVVAALLLAVTHMSNAESDLGGPR